MTLLQLTAILLSLAAALAFINARWLKLPPTIGLMALALALSLLLVGVAQPFPVVTHGATTLFENINFNRAVLDGVLGYILFAGALHVELENLRQDKLIIGVMASVGVVISTLLVGAAFWGISRMLGMTMPLVYCLLLGVCISPTDPIAVLAILKSLGAPRTYKTKIAGESLFNDGVSVVIFIVLLGMTGLGGASGQVPTQSVNPPPVVAETQPEPSAAAPRNMSPRTARAETRPVRIALLFLQEVGGGVAFGLALGWLGYVMLKRLDHYQTEVLITLALVTGGYALAIYLGLSGPIAIVVVGLFVGNAGRAAASATSEKNVDMFWELINEILNAILFLLMGMEVLVLPLSMSYVIAGLLAIVVAMAARFVAVGATVNALGCFRRFAPHTVKVMTWGGLHGAVSVALALALRQYVHHHGDESARNAADLILATTYVVVVFSIIVQGLTMRPLVSYLNLAHREPEREPSEPED